jgi:hypothetical protein
MTRTSKFILWLLCGLALLVISFIVWRVNLAHDVDAKLQAIRAAGLPTNGKELNAYYPAVPDNENAALVMIQAFELMRNYPDDRSNEVASFNIPPRGQSLSTEQKKLLSDYVEMNTDALAKASEAIKLSQSRYPIDFSAGVETEFPHLMPLKNLVKAAEFKALLELEQSLSNVFAWHGQLPENLNELVPQFLSAVPADPFDGARGYAEAIQFLYGLRLFGAKFGLENTFKLAALAGNPQDRLRFIHVAGTNGKGSTCAMLESIYRAAGLRVGLFTSPHLVSFRERIQVNRQLISEADVVAAGRRIATMAETVSRRSSPDVF